MEVKFKDFFKHNEFHKCRFCGIGIRNKMTRNGKEQLMPNALYAHGEIPLRNGGKFTFNGCVVCIKQVKQKDFMHICKNDVNMVKYMNKSIMRPKLAEKCKVKCKDIKELANEAFSGVLGK